LSDPWSQAEAERWWHDYRRDQANETQEST